MTPLEEINRHIEELERIGGGGVISSLASARAARDRIIDALGAAAQPDALRVNCARCGLAGTSDTFYIEEGDEWECPACWERCEAAERTPDNSPGAPETLSYEALEARLADAMSALRAIADPWMTGEQAQRIAISVIFKYA